MRRLLPILAAALVAAAAGCGGTDRPPASKHAKPPAPHHRRARPGPFSHPLGRPHLAPGSNPSVLPGDVLIADRSNNRLLVVDPQGRIVWRFPDPGALGPGQSFPTPDDAFFTPDAKEIIATEEDAFVISVIDVATHRIVYRYGRVGVPGSGPDRLWNPDDAMMLPDGWIFSADIKNCRVILIRPHAHRLARAFGSPAQGCVHDPPYAFGSPNGAFPLSNGHFLVTEINGDWVDELSLAGHVFRSWHPPGVYYPSDTNEVRPGLYVTVGYQSPGILETFDRSGRLHWLYRPRPGDPPLDHPSLALPLPNGDFLLNDDYNDRVIVIDPRTNRVVWQYGHTGVPGSAPGYLSQPDGVDLVPPYSLLVRLRARIGTP